MNNVYTRRQVATRDMQPCMICQKLTATVLFNGSGPDWLYTCDLHLQDNPQFVTPQYSQEYTDAVERMKRTQAELSRFQMARTGSWDGWITKVFDRKTKVKDKEHKATEEGGAETEAEAETDPVKQEQKLQRGYDEALEKMMALQKKNKSFKLSDKMFEFRVQKRKHDQMLLAKRKKEAENYSNTNPEDIMQKYNFPAVPKNDTL